MAAVQAAVSQLGVPYVFGGEQPGVGFDCSGLVQWAWAQAGVSIPRTTETQWPALPHVSLDALEPGDLLFYYNLDGDNQVDHVVMYTGSGPYGTDTVIQAPFTGSDRLLLAHLHRRPDRGGPPLDQPGRDPAVVPGDRYDGPMASGRQVVGEKNRTDGHRAAPHRRRAREELEDPRLSDVDEWGRSERTRALARAIYEPIYSKWFRTEWEGLEKIPTEGGALLVANHAGAIPSDAPVIMHGIEKELGASRLRAGRLLLPDRSGRRHPVGPRRRRLGPPRQRRTGC